MEAGLHLMSCRTNLVPRSDRGRSGYEINVEPDGSLVFLSHTISHRKRHSWLPSTAKAGDTLGDFIR